MPISSAKVPLFSVITITRNNVRGLMKTHQSMMRQNCKDYEWIVVDGQSTDGTSEFLRKKRSETTVALHPFRFISEPDEGIYDAMNTGIKKAKGRYLLFLNAGDMLNAPDTLEALVPHTDKEPDFIYGDALECCPTDDKKIVSKVARRYKDLAWGMITHHQAMLYRHDIIRDNRMRYSLLYDIASDYDFTVRFLLKSKKIAYMPQPICVFEEGGISQQQASKGRKEQFLIRERLEMVSQGRNLWIFLVQTIAWNVKGFSPDLYRKIKPFMLKIVWFFDRE